MANFCNCEFTVERQFIKCISMMWRLCFINSGITIISSSEDLHRMQENGRPKSDFRGVMLILNMMETSQNWPMNEECVVSYCITHYFRGRKFSRKVNLRYFREKIFSRIYCSRENNILPRKYSRENIFLRIFFVPQICRLVGLGYAVYYSIT